MRRSACLTALVLLLSACGGSGEEGGAAPAPSGQAAPPSAAAPSAAPEPSAPDEPAPDAADGEIEGLEVLAEDLSHEHVEGPVEYDRVPPLGGPHHPRWLACDVYDEPVPLELATHSIEHGAVWVAYAPDLPAEQVEQLAAAGELDEEYVLVAPQDGLDSRVVASPGGLRSRRAAPTTRGSSSSCGPTPAATRAASPARRAAATAWTSRTPATPSAAEPGGQPPSSASAGRSSRS
jgi:hypothetical protein